MTLELPRPRLSSVSGESFLTGVLCCFSLHLYSPFLYSQVPMIYDKSNILDFKMNI